MPHEDPLGSAAVPVYPQRTERVDGQGLGVGMVHVNVAAKSVTCKLVYYGPGFSGKTTNLEAVHARAPRERRGKLLSVSTQGDRTLFFDHMPLDLGRVNGLATKFQLYTVPGQVYYAATRKLVLRGVDGVVFVADSASERLEENRAALDELEQFVREVQDEALGELPIVMQWNKRDVPDALSCERLALELNRYDAPCVEAIASEGSGVLTTLKTLSRLVIARTRSSFSGDVIEPPEPAVEPTIVLVDSPDPSDSKALTLDLPPTPAVKGPPVSAQAELADSDSDDDDPIDRLNGTRVPTPSSACPWSSSVQRLPTPVDDPVIGQTVRGCAIHTKLAEGGMGAVYLARHPVLEKDVVVKVLKPKKSHNPRRVERFLREARLAAVIDHPNMVTIQDVGTNENGLHYILMEYVAGKNLHELIEEHGRQSIEEATRIVLEVSRALTCLHAASVIHRDVKAENIVLTPSRGVKLIDFGLAKDLQDEGNLTIPGAMIGTPVYMAPEIGRVADVDGRADIYSLGLTYYYLLTGKRPYEGCSLDDILFQRVSLSRPERHLPNLPQRYRHVLSMMLAFERDERYATAAELAADLDALLCGAPIRASGSGRWQSVDPAPTLDPEIAPGGGTSPPPGATPRSVSSAALNQEVDAARAAGRNLVGGRYLLLTELDPSGALRLYRAWDVEDERLISLRIFDCVDRITPAARRSMKLAGRLRHPFLLPLRHTRLHQGQLFAAMYPVRGQSLLSLSGGGARLRPEDAARVIRDVAKALGYAHAKGQVHGGFQPDSVLVGPEGQGLLLDLGLGAVLRQATRGLPSRVCRAPECVEGEPPSARSDIYSLGAVLYMALCGEPPSDDPPGVRVSGVLPELDAICMRCLAPDPELRYDSARDLQNDLDAFLAGAVPRARSGPSLPFAVQRAYRDYALLASVVMLVLTSLMLVSSWNRANVMEAQAARYEAMLNQLEEAQRTK